MSLEASSVPGGQAAPAAQAAPVVPGTRPDVAFVSFRDVPFIAPDTWDYYLSQPGVTDAQRTLVSKLIAMGCTPREIKMLFFAKWTPWASIDIEDVASFDRSMLTCLNTSRSREEILQLMKDLRRQRLDFVQTHYLDTRKLKICDIFMGVDPTFPGLGVVAVFVYLYEEPERDRVAVMFQVSPCHCCHCYISRSRFAEEIVRVLNYAWRSSFHEENVRNRTSALPDIDKYLLWEFRRLPIANPGDSWDTVTPLCAPLLQRLAIRLGRAGISPIQTKAVYVHPFFAEKICTFLAHGSELILADVEFIDDSPTFTDARVSDDLLAVFRCALARLTAARNEAEESGNFEYRTPPGLSCLFRPYEIDGREVIGVVIVFTFSDAGPNSVCVTLGTNGTICLYRYPSSLNHADQATRRSILNNAIVRRAFAILLDATILATLDEYIGIHFREQPTEINAAGNSEARHHHSWRRSVETNPRFRSIGQVYIDPEHFGTCVDLWSVISERSTDAMVSLYLQLVYAGWRPSDVGLLRSSLSLYGRIADFLETDSSIENVDVYYYENNLVAKPPARLMPEIRRALDNSIKCLAKYKQHVLFTFQIHDSFPELQVRILRDTNDVLVAVFYTCFHSIVDNDQIAASFLYATPSGGLGLCYSRDSLAEPILFHLMNHACVYRVDLDLRESVRSFYRHQVNNSNSLYTWRKLLSGNTPVPFYSAVRPPYVSLGDTIRDIHSMCKARLNYLIFVLQRFILRACDIHFDEDMVIELPETPSFAQKQALDHFKDLEDLENSWILLPDCFLDDMRPIISNNLRLLVDVATFISHVSDPPVGSNFDGSRRIAFAFLSDLNEMMQSRMVKLIHDFAAGTLPPLGVVEYPFPQELRPTLSGLKSSWKYHYDSVKNAEISVDQAHRFMNVSVFQFAFWLQLQIFVKTVTKINVRDIVFLQFHGEKSGGFDVLNPVSKQETRALGKFFVSVIKPMLELDKQHLSGVSVSPSGTVTGLGVFEEYRMSVKTWSDNTHRVFFLRKFRHDASSIAGYIFLYLDGTVSVALTRFDIFGAWLSINAPLGKFPFLHPLLGDVREEMKRRDIEFPDEADNIGAAAGGSSAVTRSQKRREREKAARAKLREEEAQLMGPEYAFDAVNEAVMVEELRLAAQEVILAEQQAAAAEAARVQEEARLAQARADEEARLARARAREQAKLDKILARERAREQARLATEQAEQQARQSRERVEAETREAMARQEEAKQRAAETVRRMEDRLREAEIQARDVAEQARVVDVALRSRQTDNDKLIQELQRQAADIARAIESAQVRSDSLAIERMTAAQQAEEKMKEAEQRTAEARRNYDDAIKMARQLDFTGGARSVEQEAQMHTLSDEDRQTAMEVFSSMGRSAVNSLSIPFGEVKLSDGKTTVGAFVFRFIPEENTLTWECFNCILSYLWDESHPHRFPCCLNVVCKTCVPQLVKAGYKCVKGCEGDWNYANVEAFSELDANDLLICRTFVRVCLWTVLQRWKETQAELEAQSAAAALAAVQLEPDDDDGPVARTGRRRA